MLWHVLWIETYDTKKITDYWLFDHNSLVSIRPFYKARAPVRLTQERPKCALHHGKMSTNKCCARYEITTDLNTWIAGSHGFASSSMRATGNTSVAILLQSKHLIDTLTSTHISAWNATGDRFLASNFMKILRKKMKKFHRSSRLLNIYWKLLKNLLM